MHVSKTNDHISNILVCAGHLEPLTTLCVFFASPPRTRLKECEAKPLVRQMVDAVHYMHTVGIVHR